MRRVAVDEMSMSRKGWQGVVHAGCWFSSPLCTASREAMVLWCQTVISSVQGRIIRMMAKMSRLFGISRTEWTHSSSLPDSENPRDRQNSRADMENRNQWARKNPGREKTRAAKTQDTTAWGSYQRSQPTHCTSRVWRGQLPPARGGRLPVEKVPLDVPGATGHGLQEACNAKQKTIGRWKS